jgi:N-acetylglucosaminyldiphosphoundecaprenol N-acetyl-beta-D-mannosaminyltransferase
VKGFATQPILGVDVAAVTVDGFIDLMIEAARERRRWRVGYVNAANYNLAARDSRYAEALRSFDLVYADGQAVVWAARYLGRPIPERVNAGDFFVRFCRRCARAGISLYLLGSRPGVAERAAECFRSNAPGLRILGFQHGHFDPAQSGPVVEAINAADPDILVIGMGSPRQELWAAENFERLHVGVAWTVGALFEYFGGERRRAPLWMRKAGLEWLFRLALEPRRLWRRYLVGNWQFLWKVWKERRNERKRRKEKKQ